MRCGGEGPTGVGGERERGSPLGCCIYCVVSPAFLVDNLY